MDCKRQKYVDPREYIPLFSAHLRNRRFDGRGRVLRRKHDLQGIYITREVDGRIGKHERVPYVSVGGGPDGAK